MGVYNTLRGYISSNNTCRYVCVRSNFVKTFLPAKVAKNSFGLSNGYDPLLNIR